MTRNTVIAFISGALLGAFGMYKYIQIKMEKEALESEFADDCECESDNMDSVENVKINNGDWDDTVKMTREERQERKKTLREKNQAKTNYAKPYKTEEPKEYKEPIYSPHLIDFHQFGEIDDFGQQCLTLYSDGTLADEDDEVVDYETVGGTTIIQLLREVDEVYVRNDEKQCDYELIKSSESYLEVTGKDPVYDE